MSSTKESAFQNDIIHEMVAGGWLQGDPAGYDREKALYSEDALAFVKASQPKMWEKYCGLYPNDPEQAFLGILEKQLSKADPHATDHHLRTYGTLGVMRHGLKDKSCSFKLCQFKPDHGLNPDTLNAYQANILRVVPELVYSPYATQEHLEETGVKAKAWRIDLVLFLNGIPIVTMELKSEFKQAIDNAVKQYKKTRLPKDPATNKVEPLLTFKRGALVHFAVSQYEVQMSTHLQGDKTRFLPFNKGTSEGGAGNDVPDNMDDYATGYLWNEVLAPENILNIVGRFIHLEIQEEEDWKGLKTKKETLIFPRYHQWDLVRSLISTTRNEGPGQRYLAQHSAGSGKSNSIAWTAHQLSSLYDAEDNKLFHSVIVVTDRTVLDAQLQDTIYQFEHADGVVGKINKDEGQGSKSNKLAAALSSDTPIIIVTIQTFPHVLDAIENDVSLKKRRYAIIADEAHSSQSGNTAHQLKRVLSYDRNEDGDEFRSTEDLLAQSVEARRKSPNISYYAFTATPKSKTLELFGRPDNPEEPTSKDNKPKPFHIYSMRQAIEEGYILDVLKNYTSYKVAYQLAQAAGKSDEEVDAKKAKVKLGQWVKLHDYNIAQKVKVIAEHFQDKVAGLLGGHAKAMVVTDSRKAAVRYKLAFDQYVQENGYSGMNAMVAFSGEVEFNAGDPNAEGLLGETFTETSMNPGLKGRDLRKAFDTDDYHVMIVAQKFQTGFDQPKLCAMYVDKKLGGVDCVQTISRLNRVFPGKAETYVIDFFNDPEDVLAAFQEFYETASLLDVSDPNLIWELEEKIKSAGIFTMSEVNLFAEVFFTRKKGNSALSNACKAPAERWQTRYAEASAAAKQATELLARSKKSGDPVLIANAEGQLKDATKALDALGMFKADLASFTRYYEFMSQIIDYESTDLEKLSLFARHLVTLLRETSPEEDPVDLSSVELTHYRLSITGKQDLVMEKGGAYGQQPGSEMGSGKSKSKEEIFLSEIIARLNEIFMTENLSDSDMVNYLQVVVDKVAENESVVKQGLNNSREQVLLGDFEKVVMDAVISCGEIHEKLMTQYLTDKRVTAAFNSVVLDKFLAELKAG